MVDEPRATPTGQALVETASGAVIGAASIADVFCSIPTNKENRAQIVRLLQGASKPISEMVNKQLKIKHVLAHRVESISEDGEPLDLIRCVVVDSAGNAYSASGLGVYKSLRNLMTFYNMPPWEPELTVEVVPVQTRRKFTTYALQPVE